MNPIDILQAMFNLVTLIVLIYLLWCGMVWIARKGKK